MSQESSPSNNSSLHLPVAFIALTLAVFLGAQIVAVSEQKKLLRWQLDNASTQQENLKNTETQYKNLVAQRGDMVKQSQAIQGKFQELFQDLLKLSEDDEDAKKVVDKWKIQRSAGAKEGDKSDSKDAKASDKKP